MIGDTFIARKYAVAFLNLYINKIDDATFLNIQKSCDYLLYNHDAILFFSLPNASLSVKAEFIDLFLKKFKLPKEFKKLILILIKHNRTGLITDVLKGISYLYQDMTNSMKFEISTVCKLNKSEADIVEKFLLEKSGKRIIPVLTIDKSLIAGVSMQSDLLLWNFSVSKQLEEAKKIAYKEMERLDGN